MGRCEGLSGTKAPSSLSRACGTGALQGASWTAVAKRSATPLFPLNQASFNCNSSYASTNCALFSLSKAPSPLSRACGTGALQGASWTRVPKSGSVPDTFVQISDSLPGSEKDLFLRSAEQCSACCNWSLETRRAMLCAPWDGKHRFCNPKTYSQSGNRTKGQ